MADAGDWQTALGVNARHAAKTATAHGRAVISVLARNDMGLFLLAQKVPVMAHGADIGVVCVRAA